MEHTFKVTVKNDAGWPEQEVKALVEALLDRAVSGPGKCLFEFTVEAVKTP